jgi:hypothetical protein
MANRPFPRKLAVIDIPLSYLPEQDATYRQRAMNMTIA